MKPTIYIAGPMRGVPNDNRDAFNAAARRLAVKGWQPVNPVDIARILPCVCDDGTCDDVALSRLLLVELCIVTKCDALYLLNRWERSVGARNELATYIKVGPTIPHVFLESNGVPDAGELPSRTQDRGTGNA